MEPSTEISGIMIGVGNSLNEETKINFKKTQQKTVFFSQKMRVKNFV